MPDFNQAMDQAFRDLGAYGWSMKRDRPYDGQPHTDLGVRGSTEVRGVTFRDLRDCWIRAAFQASAHLFPDETPSFYDEAEKGEEAALCEQDLYRIDWDKIDPMAVFNNFSCEVEKLMGIYPNVPEQKIPPKDEGGG